jgi:hypothetical protein
MTEIDPSYWEPPDDPATEDRFFDAFADAVRDATAEPNDECDCVASRGYPLATCRYCAGSGAITSSQSERRDG